MLSDGHSNLKQWIETQTKPVVIVAHSYGADTAAAIVASGVRVDTLVTLDPVSFFRPDLSLVRQNSGTWIDMNAGYSGITLPNAIAAIGGKWGSFAQPYADQFIDVNLDHGRIGGKQFLGRIIK